MKWLREELSRFRKGIQGEKDSAYYLDQYFKGGQNHVLLHDLRFVVDGDVVQIDHLIINRGFGCYLIDEELLWKSHDQRSRRVHRRIRRGSLLDSIAD